MREKTVDNYSQALKFVIMRDKPVNAYHSAIQPVLIVI